MRSLGKILNRLTSTNTFTCNTDTAHISGHRDLYRRIISNCRAMEALPPEPMVSAIIERMAPSTRNAYQHYRKKYILFRGDQPDSKNLVNDFLVEERRLCKPSTLRVILSHIRKYLLLERKLELGDMDLANLYLKAEEKSDPTRSAPCFTKEQVIQYLHMLEDSDATLATRLLILVGTFAGLRSGELHDLQFSDVNVCDAGLKISIRRSKTDQQEQGTYVLIPSIEDPSLDPVKTFLRYSDLVPEKTNLFLQYHVDKYVRQPIGKNSFTPIIQTMAKALKLEHWEAFRTHSLRSTMATILADAEGTEQEIKRHGRWKSSSVASEYVRSSHLGEIKVAKKMADTIDQESPLKKKPTIILQNCTITCDRFGL